jgi:hypothetical protein
MIDYGTLFPALDPYAEACAYAWGLGVMAEADRLIERYEALGYDAPMPRARMMALAQAATLDDYRIGFGYGHNTREQRAGLRIQADYWRQVAREIREREEASCATT